MRSDKVLKNGLLGSLYQVVTILLGFIGRSFFIKYLGAEYLGINGLFTNILTVFSLTELGFSSSISFHLYRLLAIDDEDRIAGVIRFYRKIYIIVALGILTLGLVFLPFLKYTVKDSSFSLNYIISIYIIYIFKSVSSYFFSYYDTLATADQKRYILTSVEIWLRIIISLANILTLVLFNNYIIYLTIEITIGVIGNYVKSRKVKKKYSYLKKAIEIDEQLKRNIYRDVKNIFASKVSTVIVTSTDNILISILINVTTVGLYSNYSMIISYIQSFISHFTSATQASLGNTLALESKEYYYNILKRLTVILYFITSFCTVCLYILLNPFILAWIGENYILKGTIVFICVFNFYLQIIKTPIWYSISGLGYFKEDRNIAIYGAISNLIVSILAANLWGLFGIFFGTAFSQITQWIFKIKLFCEKYMEIKIYEYLRLVIRLTILTFILTLITWLLCLYVNLDNPYLSLLVKMMVCIIVPNLINYILFRNTEDYKYLIKTTTRIFLAKL